MSYGRFKQGFKLNGTHQLLLCADCAKLLGKKVHTVKKSAEALLVGSKQVGLEICADKTRYMYHEQNAGQKSQHKVGSESFERVAEFSYLGTALTNQNHIYKEIKSRLNSGNACCHLIENLFCFHLLSKNINLEVEI
jgi:hypothetical protein